VTLTQGGIVTQGAVAEPHRQRTMRKWT